MALEIEAVHQIHKAWSEFSAAWSRGNLGQEKRNI